jgi:AcrR family transcriptional regulator
MFNKPDRHHLETAQVPEIKNDPHLAAPSAVSVPGTVGVPGTGRRREESERRRLSILEAARRCFGRDGYAGATVALIAEEAGVSNGLLYQFFRNKDHLLEVVLKGVVREWVRALVPRDEEREQPSVALEQMFRRSVDFCARDPLLPALLSSDPSLQLQRITLASAGRLEPHRALIAEILVRGIEKGEFRADLDITSAADLICQLTADYSRRAYASDPQFPATPAIIDAVARFILDGVRAH